MKTITCKMRLLRTGVTAIILGCMLLTAGCSKDGAKKPKGEGPGNIKSSNMAGAKALFRTGGGMMTRGEGEEPKLWQVGVDETTKTVVFTDEEGNTVPAVTDRIKDLSDRYFAMRVCQREEDRQSGPHYYYVVRKSDGELATTDLQSGYSSILANLFGWQTWQTFKADSQGNIYFGTEVGMYKIYESGGQTSFILAARSASLEYWWMNGAGDMVWYRNYRKADGTVITLPDSFINGTQDLACGQLFTVDAVPASFFRLEEYTQERKTVLVKYTPALSEPELVREEIYVFPFYASANSFAETVNGRGIMMLYKAGSDDFYACVVSGSTPNVNFYDIPLYGCTANISQIGYNAVKSDKYLYGYSNNDVHPYYNTISRFDPATGENIDNYFAMPSGYGLVHVLGASNSGILTILATKAGTSDQVFLELDADRQLTEHGTYDGSPVTLYERLD